MGRLETKWTHEQREAVATAYLDRAIRPAKRIQQLARTGELAPSLEPFDMPTSTIYDAARQLQQRRAGEALRGQTPARTSQTVQGLRRRLTIVADRELGILEAEQLKANKTSEPQQRRRITLIRELGRAVREIAALPQEGDRGVPPGQQVGGERGHGDPQPGPNTIAGRAIAAHRARKTGGEGDRIPPSSPPS